MKNRKQNHEFEPTKRNAAIPVLKGLLVGSVVGAATALLFAPRAGEETRAEIRGKALELRDRTTDTVKDTVSQAKSKASELKDNVLDKATDLKERGKRVVSKQLDHVSETAEASKERVQAY